MEPTYRVISYNPKEEKDFTSVYELSIYTHSLLLEGRSYDIQTIDNK